MHKVQLPKLKRKRIFPPGQACLSGSQEAKAGGQKVLEPSDIHSETHALKRQNPKVLIRYSANTGGISAFHMPEAQRRR